MFGISNIGNTCAFSSVLQLLFPVREFIGALSTSNDESLLEILNIYKGKVPDHRLIAPLLESRVGLIQDPTDILNKILGRVSNVDNIFGFKQEVSYPGQKKIVSVENVRITFSEIMSDIHTCSTIIKTSNWLLVDYNGVATQCFDVDDGKFILLAAVVYDSGHYYAHRVVDGKWYCFNDTTIMVGAPLRGNLWLYHKI